MKIFTTGPAEQVSSATHERKKIISMSKFFAGGGEMMEWKTALINANLASQGLYTFAAVAREGIKTLACEVELTHVFSSSYYVFWI